MFKELKAELESVTGLNVYPVGTRSDADIIILTELASNYSDGSLSVDPNSVLRVRTFSIQAHRTTYSELTDTVDLIEGHFNNTNFDMQGLKVQLSKPVSSFTQRHDETQTYSVSLDYEFTT